MPKRRLGIEVLWYVTSSFCSLPPFPKREVSRAPQDKRILAFPSQRRGDAREGYVLRRSYLREETEEGFCLEGKRGLRINFQKKVEHQENQSSRKLLQQHREQEIGRKKAPNSFEEPTLLGEHNFRDDNLREERGGAMLRPVMPIPCRSRNTEDHVARQ